MLIYGNWLVCSDRIVRPVIRGEIEGADGTWEQVPFLVDTAADRTVLTANVLDALGLEPANSSDQLVGVGGTASSVVLSTRIQFPRDGGGNAIIRGDYAAFTDPAALDMCVLGRDVTNLFAVLVDRPRDVVCLLGLPHFYTIGCR